MPAAALSIRVPAEAEQMAPIRAELADYAHVFGIAKVDVEDAQTIVTEACGNSIRYAYGDAPGGPMEVDASVEDGELRLTIRDFGSGIGRRSTATLPGLHAGLAIIGALSKSFRLTSRRGRGTELEARLSLSGPA
ncbi:MAG TPA: ATP-binding protein [Solirubrobacterales bacterium]|nr:ATP-binding protein [Solirubrobacterales bacterium]